MMSTGGLSQTKWSPCKEFFLKNYFDCLNNTRVSCHRRVNAGDWGALDNSARDEIIDRAIIAQKGGLKSGGKFELPFGATEVFPRLKVSVARWQNLIPSFPWIAPGWRAWGGNPRKGRDQILQRSVAEP